MSYNIAGVISSSFVFLSLIGIFFQLRLIWDRKKQAKKGELDDGTPTSILSLNRFFTSFSAFFSMFLYGLTLEPFDHYLVWPRIMALFLVLYVLFEVLQDRRSKRSFILFFSAVILMVMSLVLGFTSYRTSIHTIGVPQIFIIVALVLYVQGAIHQIYIVRNSGRTGALSLKMHQLFFMKDLSSLSYGITMGSAQGWPVILFYTASLIMQSITIWHFRWAKVSPLAKDRRCHDIYN